MIGANGEDGCAIVNTCRKGKTKIVLGKRNVVDGRAGKTKGGQMTSITNRVMEPGSITGTRIEKEEGTGGQGDVRLERWGGQEQASEASG